MTKYAAGTVSGEWLTVWAISRFTTTAFEVAERRLKERGIEGKKVRVLGIEDWEYERALKQIQKNEPYYIRFSEKPLSENEMDALFTEPTRIVVDCSGMHEGVRK